ncbi:MAG: hypothetical protein LBI11_01385 [Streptococcaceae bacterium]|jgi:hypothetical protein|nr:hypothetical protein [Streptococcaceae bacterium]
MIFLFGDYSVYNRNAAIYGVKRLFDAMGEAARIVTPTMDAKLQKRRAAAASGFTKDSIWSIYDCFTGRMTHEARVFMSENYRAPEGYEPAGGGVSKRFVAANGEEIKLLAAFDGRLEAVEFYSHNQLVKRENYDDGGYLSTIDIPMGEDTHTKVVNQQGVAIFELYQVGKYRQVAKVKFVPENLNFLSEAEFWKWAFERLVAAKAPEDKFFIMNETFRRALVTASFSSENVYLLMTAPLDEHTSKDILFDHYEKLIFNSQNARKTVEFKFDEKTKSKLFWNNFIAADRVAANYTADSFSVYLNLGSASDTIDFDEAALFVKTVLDEEEKVSFTIEFTLLRDQVDFLKRLAALGLTDDVLRTRVTPLTRPWPDKIAEEMARAILYLHYQNDEIVSQPLMTAIASDRPILALTGDSLLDDYVDDNNGKLISDTSLVRLVRQMLYDVEFIKYVAPAPQETRKRFDNQATMMRWRTIFEDKGRKL